jgi:hypothetical protein
MRSHVSAENLSKALSTLLGSGGSAVINNSDAQSFIEDLAEVACKHVGGAVVAPGPFADMPGQGVVIRNDDSRQDRMQFWSQFLSPSSFSKNTSQTQAELAHQVGRKDIFAEMLASKSFVLDGETAVRVQYRSDLVAQERINLAPTSTVIDERLLEDRPDLHKACLAMCQTFAIAEWNGQLLESFSSEYARHHDPSSTTIVQLTIRRGRGATFTLQNLWDAQPTEGGNWVVSGRTLSFKV